MTSLLPYMEFKHQFLKCLEETKEYVFKIFKMADELGANLDLSQLRNLVRQYIDNHMYKTALFWADKVYSLSKKQRTRLSLVSSYILSQ